MIFLTGILVCVLFGYIVTYLYNRNQVYEFSMDKLNAIGYLWGESSRLMLTAEDVKKVNNVLEAIGYEEYNEKVELFNSEYYALSDYKTLIIEKKADEILSKTDRDYILIDGARYTRNQIEHIAGMYEGYSPERIDELKQTYNVARICLKYAVGYDEYRKYVVENSKKLAGISIFNKSIQDEIRAKGDDYSALAEVRVKAYIFAGFEKLLDNPFGNLMAAVMAVFCSVAAAAFIKGTGRRIYVVKHYARFEILFAAGLLILFICEALAVNKTFKIEGLRYSIQSVDSFVDCVLDISTGLFLMIKIALRTLFFYALFLTLKYVFVSCLVYFSVPDSDAVGQEREMIKKKDHRIWYVLLLTILVMTVFAGKMVFSDTALDILNIIFLFGLLVIISLFIEWRFCVVLNVERKKIERKYLSDIDEKYTEMRTLKHDMNNHLSAILMLMDAGKNDEARKYITELTGVASRSATIRKTGIRALDLLLWNKVSQAAAENIRLDYRIDDEYSDVSISEYEICSLFANVLDNAIEAVRCIDKSAVTSERKDNTTMASGHIDNTEETVRYIDNDKKTGLQSDPVEMSGVSKKYITMTVRRQMDMMCIFCENPYLNVEKDNGKYVTTKAQKMGHGLGLKQIERIALKHGGTVQIDDSDGVFRISVILNV